MPALTPTGGLGGDASHLMVLAGASGNALPEKGRAQFAQCELNLYITYTQRRANTSRFRLHNVMGLNDLTNATIGGT